MGRSEQGAVEAARGALGGGKVVVLKIPFWLWELGMLVVLMLAKVAVLLAAAVGKLDVVVVASLVHGRGRRGRLVRV
jgi:hypothetical protein